MTLPSIARSLGEQLSAIVSPAVDIIEGRSPASSHAQQLIASPESQKRKPNRHVRSGTKEAAHDGAQTIEFRHDPAKYGTPTQHWNTAQKAIWLLYVVKDVMNIGELSTGQIVKTFNLHFRQAKTVTSSNVARDLGKAKVSTPALVGEDPTKSPPGWFLTDEGVRRAQALIAEALMPKAA